MCILSHVTSHKLAIAQADYVFELDLQSYRNPGGKTFQSVCCETQATNPADGSCLVTDTCDPRFNIRLQNFNDLTTIGQDYTLGVFTNMDSITFPNCELITSMTPPTGVQNPLRFIFPTTAFRPTNTIRIIMDIAHVEDASTTPIVSNFVQEISRIPGTNPAFSNIMTGAAPNLDTLTIQFRYRLICTSGTCGNDCSQTTGCSGFPEACPSSCDATTPCMNGGTCDVSNSNYFHSSLSR